MLTIKHDYGSIFTKGLVLPQDAKNPIIICDRLNLSPEKILQYCASTFVLANLSKCVRRKTGALVLDFYDGVPNIVGTGCNGGSAGGTNDCETGPCLTQTKAEIIHSEVNAMRSLPDKNSTRILFCTDSPCAACLDAIEKNGTIDLMIFVREYRIVDHLQTSTVPWVVVDDEAVRTQLQIAMINMVKVFA